MLFLTEVAGAFFNLEVYSKKFYKYVYNKESNIHLIRVPDGEEKESGPERVFEEIIAKIFPNLSNSTDFVILQI